MTETVTQERRQMVKAIMLAMQGHDFGHETPAQFGDEGSTFTCSMAQIDLLEKCCNDAVDRLLALRQSDTSEGGGEPWIEGVESAPLASTVLATYWSEEHAEWIVQIFVAERPTAPFTHWQYVTRPGEAPPVNKSPTPEHVEGDVLSVGEMEALSRRLRDYRPPALDPAHGREHHPICDEAADALTSATTRIQRAERERDAQNANATKWFQNFSAAVRRVEASEAQLADAVKVLKEIAADTKHTTFGEARTWGAKTAQSFLSTIGENPDAE